MPIVEFPRFVLRLSGLCLVLLAVAFVGCGPPTAKTSGKVTADGKPVTEGTLIFSPTVATGGVPVSVPVKSDGTYETHTAVVGMSIISYNAPPAKYPEGYVPKASEPAPESPFAGLIPEKKEVEVKAGANTIDITLIRLGELPKTP